jgi:hypothetical protein
LDIAVLVTTFNVVFRGNGWINSLSELRRKRAKKPKSKSAIATITALVRINSETESVAVFSSVKSFKTIEFAPEITKKARHTGIVALENFCFVPIYGITVAIIIRITDMIMVMLGL